MKLSHLVVRRIKEEFKNFFRLFLAHDVAGIVHSVQELAYGLEHEISFYSKTFSPALEPIQPFISWTTGLGLGSKAAEHDFDHSPQYGAKVTNKWSHVSTL